MTSISDRSPPLDRCEYEYQSIFKSGSLNHAATVHTGSAREAVRAGSQAGSPTRQVELAVVEQFRGLRSPQVTLSINSSAAVRAGLARLTAQPPDVPAARGATSGVSVVGDCASAGLDSIRGEPASRDVPEAFRDAANHEVIGASGRARTFDPRLRRPVLYPPELRTRG